MRDRGTGGTFFRGCLAAMANSHFFPDLFKVRNGLTEAKTGELVQRGTAAARRDAAPVSRAKGSYRTGAPRPARSLPSMTSARRIDRSSSFIRVTYSASV